MRIAAVGDLHCGVGSVGMLEPLFGATSRAADVLVLCGDLTDYGRPEEAQVLAQELRVASPAPIVAVLGNHDFESGTVDEVRGILEKRRCPRARRRHPRGRRRGLRGSQGSGRWLRRARAAALGRGGHEAPGARSPGEALKLESALARLRTPVRVGVLHYSPVRDTVVGEPPEIFAFLGSSRLEEPLVRYSVTLALHGHAHHGSPEGRIRTGAPVYNVCLPLLRAASPTQLPFRVIDLGEVPGGRARRDVLSGTA